MGKEVNKMWCLTGEHVVKLNDVHEERAYLFQRVFDSVEAAKDYATHHYRKHTGLNFAQVFWPGFAQYFWGGKSNRGVSSPNIVTESIDYMLDQVDVRRWPL